MYFLQYQPLIDKIVMQLCELFVQEIEKDNSDMADGMRYLFDITSFLHQNVFQSDDSVVPMVDKSFIEQMQEEDIQWRKSLVPGSKIDAIKVDLEYSLKGWAKA